MQKRQDSWQSCFIFLIGPSGSGKTIVSVKLAELMDWPAIDTDDLIEQGEGQAISDIFAEKGELYFRRLESGVVDAVLSDGDKGVVATGGGLPTIDGMMTRLSVAGPTVYLKASLDELWNRLTVDRYELEKRPLLRKKGRAGLESMLRQREAVYNSADLTVLTDSMSVDDIAKKTHEILAPSLCLGD